jgi:hypothetical protein
MRRGVSRFSTLLIFFGVMTQVAVSRAAPSAGAAGAYLKLGQNPRAMALGGAYTAAVDDATAAYWNPAQLDALERQELFLAYTALPGGGDYSHLAYALPMSEFSFPEDKRSGSAGKNKLGTLAISFIQLGMAYDIEARQVDSLNPNYLFSDIEGCYGLAYGVTLVPDWRIGVQVKGLYHWLDQTRATGWGVDAGASWTGLPGFTAAVDVRNAFAQLDWPTGTHELFPLVVTAGAAYTYAWPGGHETLGVFSLERRLTPEPIEPKAGLEYNWARILFARVGFDSVRFTWGAGVRVPELGWGRLGAALDYAAAPDPIDGWQHWASLRILF